MFKLKACILILSMSLTLNSYAQEREAIKATEGQGVDVKQLVKTLKVLSNAFSAIGRVGGGKTKTKNYNRKTKAPKMDNCAYAVNIHNDLICKARVEIVLNPKNLVKKNQRDIIVSVQENIVSQPHVYERHFTQKFRDREDYERLAKFKGECRKRYISHQSNDNTVKYITNFSLDFSSPDHQLFDHKYGSHNWPSLNDQVGNLLCQADYNSSLTPNLRKKYNQFVITNKTEVIVPGNSLDELKAFQLEYSSSYNNTRNQNLTNSKNSLQKLIDQTERLRGMRTYKDYNRLDQIRLNYLASRNCNKFAQNLMLENQSILIAYCPKNSDSFVFSKYNFSKSKIVILGTKALNSVRYKDLDYEDRMLEVDLRDTKFTLKLESI